MQSHDAYPDLPANSTGTHANGATATPVAATQPYIHPTIPLGLPHVVQFVEASLCQLPMSVRFVGDRLSRYANAKGEVSMAASFLCQITGLGSRNTADHHLRLIESLGVLEKKPGQGGKDRKSNTYVFLGQARNWKPLPTERPGTDPWVALAQARRENEALRGEIEELQAELARLMNGGTIAHPGVTDGGGVPHPEQPSHSYETADPSGSTGESGAIAHSELSNGSETVPPQEGSHSYGTADPDGSTGESEAIAHSELSNGKNEAQEYLARRDRVESMVIKHRAYYDRSFHRRGVLGAIEYFSRSVENQQELVRQVGILDAGQDPAKATDEAPQQTEGPAPPVNQETGRREVEYCPDCGSPYTTFNGEERCPDCTDLRRRESQA